MRKRIIVIICCVYTICANLTACTKKTTTSTVPPPPVVDTGLVNTSHLDKLYTPVTFPDNAKAAGVYIYSEYPDYHLVEATGEGFACVDDVARAALVYLRGSKISTDTTTQSKLYNLIQFIIEMQSTNGYFYNFLFTGNTINTSGVTSVNNPNWWSWRALQTLTEAAAFVKNNNASLYTKMNLSINKLIAQIKVDLVGLPKTTTTVSGITIPQWLPAGSGTDQSATLILGLINYCSTTNDTTISAFIGKLADGITLMQQGDSTNFPFSAFLSWENTWHAYGNAQAYALMKAAVFLNNSQYTIQATKEVDNYYPWLLQNGYQSSFTISDSSGINLILTENSYAQIAYGIEPMVFAAAEAYKETGQYKYADYAGHLAAWFLGANSSAVIMYDASTGICFDALSATGPNLNSGAESTIEALLSLEKVQSDPVILAAFNKYKK